MDSISSSIIDTGTWCSTTPLFLSGKGDLEVFTVSEVRICFEDDEISSREMDSVTPSRLSDALLSSIGRWSCASTTSIIDTGTSSSTTRFFLSCKGDLAVFTFPEVLISFEDDEIISSDMALFLDPLFAVTDVEACPKYETKGAPPSAPRLIAVIGIWQVILITNIVLQ